MEITETGGSCDLFFYLAPFVFFLHVHFYSLTKLQTYVMRLLQFQSPCKHESMGFEKVKQTKKTTERFPVG